MPDWLPPILLAVIAASPGLYAIWRARRKTDAETAKSSADAVGVLTGSAVEMVKRWEARTVDLERRLNGQEQKIAEQGAEIEALKERVDALEDENECLRDGAERLESQVVGLGHTPVWSVSDLRQKRAGQ